MRMDTLKHQRQHQHQRKRRCSVQADASAGGGREPPKPLRAFVVRWAADRWSRGAYSSVGVSGSGADYDALAEPLGGQLFWARAMSTRDAHERHA